MGYWNWEYYPRNKANTNKKKPSERKKFGQTFWSKEFLNSLKGIRIGQQKNVLVHRLINQGTLEERIDDMIQSKKHLANITVASGETWLGDLSNKELRELVALSEHKE